MANKAYYEKLDSFRDRMLIKLRNKVLKSKTISQHKTITKKVLTVENCNCMLTCNPDRWVTEVCEDGLIDQYGVVYPFRTLKDEELCQVVDEVLYGILYS